MNTNMNAGRYLSIFLDKQFGFEQCLTLVKKTLLGMIISYFLLLFSNPIQAQDNTLSNSSFEYTGGIPTRHSMFDDYAKVWCNAFPRSVSTPDLYLNNSTVKFTSWNTVYDAVSIKDATQFHGCAFAGLFLNYFSPTTDPKFKEYILQKVDLVAGRTYTLKIELAKSNLTSSDDLEFDFGIYGYTGPVPATHINYCVTQPDGSNAPLLASIDKNTIAFDVRTFTVTFTPAQNSEYIMFGGTGCGISASRIGYVYMDNIRLTDATNTVLNPEVLYVSQETRGCCFSKTKPEFVLTGNKPQSGTTVLWSQNASNPEIVTFATPNDTSTTISGAGTLRTGNYEFYYTFTKGADIAIDTFQLSVTPILSINAGIDQSRIFTNLLPTTDPNSNPPCGNGIYDMNASPSWDIINSRQYQTWWSMIRNGRSEWVFPNFCVPYDGLTDGNVEIEQGRFYGSAPAASCNQDSLFPVLSKFRNPGWHPKNTFRLANPQDTIQFLWHVKDNCNNVTIDTMQIIQNKISLVAPDFKCIGDTALLYQFSDDFYRKLGDRAGLGFQWDVLTGSGTFLDPISTSDSMHIILTGGSTVTVRLTVLDSATGAQFYCVKNIAVRLGFYTAGADQNKCGSSCGSNEFLMIASPTYDSINMYDYQTWWSMIRDDSTEWVFPNYCVPYNGLDEGSVFVEKNLFFSPPPPMSCLQGDLEMVATKYKNPGWHPRNTFTLVKPQDTVEFIWHIKDQCGVVYKDTMKVIQNRVNIEAQKTCNKRSGICPGDSIYLYQSEGPTLWRVMPKSNLTFTWSKVSGPGVVTFLRPTSYYDSMKVSMSVPGDYVIKLTVYDSIIRCSFSCQATITVRTPGYANAGADRSECNSNGTQPFIMNASPSISVINNNCMQTWWSMISDDGEEWVFPNYCVPYNGINEGSVYVEYASYTSSLPPLSCNQGDLSTTTNKNPGWNPLNKIVFTSYGTRKFIWHVKDICSGNVSTDTVKLSWSYNELEVDTIVDLTPTCSSVRISGNISGSSGGIGGCYRWRQIDGPATIETSDTTNNIMYLYDLDSLPLGTYQFEYRLGCDPCFYYDTVNVFITPDISSPSIDLATTYSGTNICYGDTVTVTASGGAQYAFLVNGIIKQDFSPSNTFRYWLFTDSSTIDVIATLGSVNCFSRGDNSIRVNVQHVPEPIIDGTSIQLCAGSSTDISAVCTGNCLIKWYLTKNYLTATPINGPLFQHAGEPFSVHPLVNTTYFAVAYDTVTGCSSQPDSIKVIINSLPVLTTTATPSGFCPPGGISTLVGNCSQMNIVIEWYHTPVRTGSPINVGGTPNGLGYDITITATDSFYGFAINQLTGCVSLPSKLIIYVNEAPTLTPLLRDTVVRCGASPVVLSASISPTTPGNTVRWYLHNFADTSYIATGLSISYMPTSPTYVYAFAVNTLSGCVNSLYDSLFVDTSAVPINPSPITASPTNICGGSTATLSLSAIDSSLEIRWFTTSVVSGTLVGVGNPFVVSPLVTTTYYAYVYNPASGCYSNTYSRTTINVRAKPNAGIDKSICQYSTVVMSGSGAGTWSALSSNPASLTFSSTISPTPLLSGFTSDGMYGVVRTSALGCTDTAFISVTSKPSAGADLIACGGSTNVLMGDGSSIGIWTSSASNPTGATFVDSLTGAASVEFTTTAAGTYRYIYAVSGCRDTVSINMSAKPNAGSDKSICQFSNVVMSGTGIGTWSALSTNPSATSFSSTVSATPLISGFSEAGSYSFIRTGSTGCTDTVVVNVEAKPDAGANITACGGAVNTIEGTGVLAGVWTSIITNPVGASFNDSATGVASVSFLTSATGIFKYYYTVGGCSDTMQFSLSAKPNAGIDKNICQYSSVAMSGIGSGTWSALAANPSATIISPPTSATPVITGCSASGLYSFIRTSALGCTDTALVSVGEKPNAGIDQIACGASSISLAGSGSVAGSWSSHSSNPSGSTLTVLTSSIVSIAFTSAASGTFRFIYSMAGCTDTTAIAATPKPNAGPDKTIKCYIVDTAKMAAIGSGTWSIGTGSPGIPTILSPTNPTTKITNFPARGLYYLIWTNSIGCADTALVTASDTCICPILNNRISFANLSYYCNATGMVTITGVAATPSLGAYLWQYDNGTGFVNAPGINNTQNYTAPSLGLGTHLLRRVFYTTTGIICSDTSASITLVVRASSSATINATVCANATHSFNGMRLNTAGDYFDTLTNVNGCDSFITLHLTVLPLSTATIDATICENETYLFNGAPLRLRGVYFDTLVNSVGCDSVLQLNLTVLPTTAGHNTIQICANDSYFFNGVTLNTSGSYLDTFVNVVGCDSFFTLNLVVNPTSIGIVNATICGNEFYDFNGQPLNSSGTYFDTLNNQLGCDSFVTCHLTVLPITVGTINATICSNQTFVFNGITHRTAGTYLDTIVNVAGCDSFLTLHLSVLPVSSGELSINLCSNDYYVFNGIALNRAGDYIDTLRNAVGCDSVVILHLNILPISTNMLRVSICSNDAYVFNGRTYTVAGTYTDTLHNYLGCDSISTLVLSLNSTSTSNTIQTICHGASINFNGINRSTAGTYLDTLTNYLGCDSFITWQLIVLPNSSYDMYRDICYGKSYYFNGSNRTVAGTYLDTLRSYNSCDSIITLHLTIQPMRSSTIYETICAGASYLFNGVNRKTSGIYRDTVRSLFGCDSFITLNLEVLPLSVGDITLSRCEGVTYLFNGVEITSDGTYKDTLTNNTGCDSFITLHLSFVSSIRIKTNTTLCEGSSIKVGSHIYDRTGVYIDTFSSAAGCDSIIQSTVTVNPILSSHQYISICSGQTVVVSHVRYAASGEYRDTFTSSNGCDSIAILTIRVLEPIIKNIDTLVCEGSLFNDVMFDTTTTLYDTLRTDFGCDSIITVLRIIVQPTIPLKVTADTTICEGSSVLLKAAGGNNVYSWSSTDNTWHPLGADKDNDSKVNFSLPTVLVTPTGTTLYIVFSRACDGSILSENVTVTVQPIPTLTIANNDTCINLGQDLILQSLTDDRIDPVRWSHDGKEICANCPNLTFHPYTPGKIFASIVDEYGCAASDSINVCVTYDCLENTLVIPNFITPNGDGKNDKFRFLNPENLPIIFLRIFDRWGEMLFESTDQEPEWDGTFNGKPCSPGTYVYTIEAGCNVKGNITKSGNVSIIK